MPGGFTAFGGETRVNVANNCEPIGSVGAPEAVGKVVDPIGGRVHDAHRKQSA